MVKKGRKTSPNPAAPSATHQVPRYGKNSVETELLEGLRLVNAAVVIPNPTLVEILMAVCIIPPATDCCCLGREDMRYICTVILASSHHRAIRGTLLTLVTVN